MTRINHTVTGAPIDAVLLDVGGVLLGPEPAPLVAALAGAGVPATVDAVVRAHYAGAAAMDRAALTDALAGDTRVRGAGDRPEDDGGWSRYFAAFAVACGTPPDRVAAVAGTLAAAFPRWTATLPGARDGLRALAGLGVALVVVSNASGRVERELADARLCQAGPGAGVRVRRVIDSHVVGLRKPDPAIFDLGLAAADVPAERALMVGDLVHTDVRGAEAAGLRAVHLDPYGDCAGGHDAPDVRGLADVVDLVRAAGRTAA